ncbi:leucine-rich repeat-containing protein 74A-like [Dreissena polymorpha]|uniref:EF-hand domain-containing protein n=1 Tax=Dreissena polymorpha TaxID=45954 RepID=A0A9D4IIV2_DREPO|nr:leucine-rich repeat-containing protein 74A-like [Dreissena polymorpha]KAH3773373.1 hypothetical protein DPMN_174732 [Dreissena polymorpha]
MSTLRPIRASNATEMTINYRRNIEPAHTTAKTSRSLAKTTEDRDLQIDPHNVLSSKTNFKNGKSRPSLESSPIDSKLDYDSGEDEIDFDDCDPTPREKYGDPVIRVYHRACKKLGTICMKSIQSALLNEKFSCKYVLLKPNDLKAACYALLDNRFVEQIDFEQNALEYVPIDDIGDVIADSTFLTHVRIASNGLKSEGAEIVCKAVQENKRIVSLDLSDNGFFDSDGKFFEKLLDNSTTLKELYLSKNNLMDLGVQALSRGLEDSATLRVLDLSWNHIRLKGAIAIGCALAKNSSLKVLNLAWNGLHSQGAESISMALSKNETLEDLDLTCNRLNEQCISNILTGLEQNKTLSTLRIALNNVTCTGAEGILKQILKNKKSALKMLDMGKQEVHDTFMPLHAELKEQRGINVIYGIVWHTRRQSLASQTADDDELLLFTCDPLTVLMECMRLQNLRLIDFFKALDVNKSNHICISELVNGLLKVGVPIGPDTLLRLFRKLDKNENQMLDYKEMVEAQNKHRQNVRQALQENVDFEKTDIGKTSVILRKVMANHYIMKSEANDVWSPSVGSS